MQSYYFYDPLLYCLTLTSPLFDRIHCDITMAWWYARCDVTMGWWTVHCDVIMGWWTVHCDVTMG